MYEIKNKFKIMVVMLISLCLAGVSFGYSGKIFIYHSAIAAANLGSPASLTISVYNALPYQDQGATGALSTYTVDPASSYLGTTPSVQIDVLSSSTLTIYLLLTGNSRYSIRAISLGDPVGPDTLISSLTAYPLGSPATAPNITSITAGYETAKYVWTLPANYECHGVELEVMDLGGTTAIGGTVTLGAVTNYAMGEVVDSRKLVSGNSYTLRVRSYINGYGAPKKYVSPWGTKDFTMLSGGVATAVSKGWSFNLAGTGTGVNTISIPFKGLNTITAIQGGTLASGGTITSGTGTKTTQDISTVQKLIAEINRQAGASIVTVFGWYDSATQKHFGLSKVDTASPVGIGDTAASILATAVSSDQPYQITVNKAFSPFGLEGFKP